MTDKPDATTHFGFREVPTEQKQQLVGEVFTSVASNYDIMNDFMSMGIHRWWKRHFIATSGIRKGDKVLDLAGGTGDIAVLAAKQVGDDGLVTLTDINAAMLAEGRDRMIDEGWSGNSETAQANAEALPFANNRFDVITMAFGLRNVTDKLTALKSMYRVLKPGGKLLVLEFSRVKSKLIQPAYDWYSFKVLPRIGEVVAKDRESYQYLAESIRRHPDQETLKGMFSEAGFIQCGYRNLTQGIVAIHSGIKA